VSSEIAGHKKDSKDYFLTVNKLKRWAVGTSLINANISAEQIIGRFGPGFASGLSLA
jgi:SSS family solute:Na+ symporter